MFFKVGFHGLIFFGKRNDSDFMLLNMVLAAQRHNVPLLVATAGTSCFHMGAVWIYFFTDKARSFFFHF